MSGPDSRPVWPVLVLAGLVLAAGQGYVFLAARLGVPFAIPVGIVGLASLAFVFRGPVGQALALRLGLRDGVPDEAAGQVLGELDELRTRVQELEERVDFSERLLAQVPRVTDREQSRL
ncbi:MAG TPA: hypothetical protein VI383_08205 [Gemmatimonadales bacterium]|nr:hypothetical protein [Gemmatimonadales bacterium]